MSQQEISNDELISNINDLSEKEKQLIKLICLEKEPKEIAQEMQITLQTVYTYKKRILRKIGAKTSIGIVVFASKNGLH